MSTDDKVNVAILIALALFCVLAFPARQQEADDAEYGRLVKLTVQGAHK